MKKLVIASAVAAAMASSVAMADTTVYGKASYYVELGTETAGDDQKSVQNSTSRIGFKSVEDLGNGMSAIAHLELGTSDEQKDPTSVRLAYAGLKGDFGQVAIGSQWTPSYLLVRGATDLFKSVGCNVCGGNSAAPFRAADALSYVNKFGDVTFAAAIVNDESDILTDAVDVAVSIPVGPVGLAFAVQNTDSDAAPDVSSATVSYSGGALTAALSLFMTDTLADDWMSVIVTYDVSSSSKVLLNVEDDGTDNIVNAGFHYGLSKKTTAYFEVAAGDLAADQTNVGLEVKF